MTDGIIVIDGAGISHVVSHVETIDENGMLEGSSTCRPNHYWVTPMREQGDVATCLWCVIGERIR